MLPDIEYLYKYRSLEGDCINSVKSTLLDGVVRFASVAEFNDPFDCAPIYEITGTNAQVDAYMKRVFRKATTAPRPERLRMARFAKNVSGKKAWSDNLNAEMRKEIENLGIYCMSGVRDHVLMWAHYANSHRGVCLRFRASSTTPFFGAAQMVNYNRDRPTVNPVIHDKDELTRNALLTKADFWSYEHEWRIVDYSRPSGVREFHGALLDGVILGAKIDGRAEQKIMDCIAQRKYPTQVFRASLRRDEFRLDIVPVHRGHT
jgi:hypothetical protein